MGKEKGARAEAGAPHRKFLDSRSAYDAPEKKIVRVKKV
jgi:hypothetical protein